MNKLFKCFLISLSIIALGSCGNNSSKTEKITLESVYKINDFVKITSIDYLKALIDSKLEFALYINSSSCLSCQETTPLLSNFLKNREDTVVYTIDVSSSLTKLDPINEIVNYKVTPTLVLYKDSEAVKKVDIESDPSVFVDTSSITKFFDEFTISSSLIKVSKESQLDEVLKSDCYFYWSYSKCGDCMYFENYYLKNILKSENSKKIYYFDMKNYFESDADDKVQRKLDFYKSYGISKDGNEEFGYKKGCVPTFQHYKNGQIIDAMVVFNDGLEYIKNSLNEIESVKVIDSYFKDAPFINNVYSKTYDLSAIENYRKSTLSFYIDKFERFLA